VGRISLLALALTVAAMAWHSTAAAVRHARVVGHGAYGCAPLDNPINDARGARRQCPGRALPAPERQLSAERARA